jgi:hypothetical protein
MRQCVASAPVSIWSFFLRTHIACFSCLLLLLAALYSHNPQAAETLAPEDTSALTWPLLPGESLNQLARLFYPNDGTMQSVFIRQTLLLNCDLHPQLQADQRFEQITSIVIPELKTLSHHASPPVKKPTSLQMVRHMGKKSMAIVTEAMRQQYQTLEQDNEQLKSALEIMHSRLDHVQRAVQKLNAAAQQAKQSPDTDHPTNPESAITAPASTQATNSGSVQQAPAAKTRFPDTPLTTGSGALSNLLASKSTIIALAGLLLFGLLLYGLMQRKRRHVAVDREQFTQWLDTVQPSIAPEQVLLKPSSLLNEVEIRAEDMLHQARIMVGSGKPKSAIQLLDHAVNSETPQPLETWLYLLDLCREAALRAEFEDYAQKLHQHYNVMTPQWEKMEVPLVVANSLEEFPHISVQLVKHWQEGGANVYLQSLLTDNRGGERAGFGPEVLEEILLLQGLLKHRE